MRLSFRNVLGGVLSASLLVTPAFANHFQADCPLTLVGQTAPVSDFQSSPHGSFRNGSVIYQLRGQTLTTLNINDVGVTSIARQDRIDQLFGRDEDGAVAYRDGFLYVTSGDAGLEIFDLRQTNGSASGRSPIFVSRTRVPHYTRIAVQGNVLAALYPIDDMPCAPQVNDGCFNRIDIYSIADPTAPFLVSRITSENNFFAGFNDIAFANGFLWTTGIGGTFAFNLSNPAAPSTVRVYEYQGNYLVTNGTDLLGVGQEKQIGVFTLGPGTNLNYFAVYTLPSVVDRELDLMFHPEAWFDDNGHLITMLDEKDPITQKPGRTIAFDVFDMSVPKYEGSDDRIYENVSWISPDELKYDPIAVGPFVYVNGEISGAQTYGACGQLAGKLEFDNTDSLPCGGAELHGYVTGSNKVSRVEVFLDNSSLGLARIGGERHDIVSSHPVNKFAVTVNLDQVTRGEHTLRVVATDVTGNTRQIYTKQIYFAGPGSNCSSRRRVSR